MRTIEKSERKHWTWSIYLLLFIFTCASMGFLAYGQEASIKTLEQEAYTSLVVYRTEQAPGQGYYTVGTIQRPRSGNDGIIMKFNELGQLEWSRVVSTPGNDALYDLDILPNGDIVVVGMTYGSGMGLNDMLILYFQPEGTLVWKKVIGGVLGETAKAVTHTPDGRIFVVGETETWSQGWSDVFVVGLYPFGEVFLTVSYGTTSQEEVFDVAPSLDPSYPGIVIVGDSVQTRGGIDGFVMNVTPDGELTWVKRFGYNGVDRFYRIIPVSDYAPGYVIAGYSSVYNDRMGDFLLVRMNMTGQIEWAKRYGAGGWDIAYDVTKTPDGGYILVGKSASYGTANDGLVVKTDWIGNFEWALRLTSVYEDVLTSVYVRDMNTYIAFGSTPALTQYNNVLIAELPLYSPVQEVCTIEIEPVELSYSDAPNNGYTFLFQQNFPVGVSVAEAGVTVTELETSTLLACSQDSEPTQPPYSPPNRKIPKGGGK